MSYESLSLPNIALESWREDATCATRDPRWWEPYEEYITAADRDRWNEAVRVCALCPVRLECGRSATSLDAGSVRAGMLVTHTGQLKPVPAPYVQQPVGRPRDRSPVKCGTPRAQRGHQRRRESCPVCSTGQFGRQSIGSSWPVVEPR